MQYGTVTGWFGAVVGDTPQDPDQDPDRVPLAGTVTFKPSADALKAASEKKTFLPVPVTAELIDGYVTRNGVRGVTLVATDSPDLNPQDFTYQVSFSGLNYDGVGVSYKSFSIAVPAGQTIDLAEVAPVAEAKGAAIVRGEKGDPGDRGAPGKDGAPGTETRWTNIDAATMTGTRRGLAAVRAGVRSAKVLCVGDSTTIGGGASVAQSYPSHLVPILAPSIPTVPGLSIPPLQGVGTDPRWVYNGWVTITSFGWADGCALVADNAASGTASFSPGVEADTFDVYYFGTGGYGSLHAELDTGEHVDIDTSQAGGTVRKVTLTAPSVSVSHSVSFTNTSDKLIAIYGVDAYVSGRPALRIGNAGVAGSTSARWGTAQGGPGGYGSVASIALYAPDLTFIMLGINDALAGVAVGDFIGSVTETIRAAKASGSVIVMSTVPSEDTAAAGLEAQYREALIALARDEGAGFVDIYSRFGSYAASQPLGFYSDTLHPSATGYADIAQVVSEAVLAS